MNGKTYKLGDYTNCYYAIAEIEVDGEIICTVAQSDVDVVIDAIKTNLLHKGIVDAKVEMGDYTMCRYDIAEIVDDCDDVICTVGQDDVETIIGILEENLYFHKVF